MMSAPALECPYCAGELSRGVIACRHCGHRVGHLLPLLARQLALSAEIAGLRAEVAALRDAAAGIAPVHAVAAAPPASSAPSPGHPHRATLAAAVLVVTAISALLHGLLLFVYDAPPLLLRLLTLVAPFALALRASRLVSHRLAIHALAAIACGLASVFAMLATTHLVDGAPLLPQDARETRETLEYSASIALAFLAGHLLARSLRASAQRARTPLAPGALTGYAQRFQQFASVLSPICAGGLALYSGLKSLIGE